MVKDSLFFQWLMGARFERWPVRIFVYQIHWRMEMLIIDGGTVSLPTAVGLAPFAGFKQCRMRVRSHAKEGSKMTPGSPHL
jgi:hypothetical protein